MSHFVLFVTHAKQVKHAPILHGLSHFWIVLSVSAEVGPSLHLDMPDASYLVSEPSPSAFAGRCSAADCPYRLLFRPSRWPFRTALWCRRLPGGSSNSRSVSTGIAP